MDNLPPELIKARQNNELIPLVGAGVSMSLKDVEGNRLFPSWTELLRYAADALDNGTTEKYSTSIKAMLGLDDFQRAAEYARKGLDGTPWGKFFHKHFEEPLAKISDESMVLPKAIWEIGNRIVTLNYDKVLRKACPERDQLTELDNSNKIELASFKRNDFPAPVVWHLHGRIGNISSLIFSAESYSKLYLETDRNYQAALDVFRGICRDNILLFIGCSLEDAELLQEMARQHNLFGGNTGPHYALVREQNKAEIELKTKGLPLELLPFADFGEPLLKLVRAIATPEPPDVPLSSEKPEKEAEDTATPTVKEHKADEIRMALLSANPLNNEQDYPHLKEFRKIKCRIDHYSLNLENLRNLQGYDYILILSKVIRNKLLIENEYLCSDRISFKELEENIGNEKTAGLFLFVDQEPKEQALAELTLPVLILPGEDKKLLRDVPFHLFQQNNLDHFANCPCRNRSAFVLCSLTQKITGNNLHEEKTDLPESIDRQKLKGFVGRSDDLEHICRKLMELDEGELLTVKGAGGIGKTHTVKKIAAALADRHLFRGGIYFIDCEPVTDSRQFQFKAAAVFGLELAEDLWQHLRDHHDGKDRLIIFDNFEPLLYLEEQDEIKKILSRIANYAKVLVTSRELLGLECEQVHQMRRLTTDEAAELFTAKFNVPEQEQELLRQDILSRQLDNNPQAIKLITGQLPKGKSLDKLREELEENLFGKVCARELEVFASGPDSNIERRASIYVSILYSYRRLNEEEKMTFELLSLFPDGIELEKFKRLTSKADKKDKLPLSLITDRLLKALEDKSMLENNSGQLKLQSMIGRFAQAMLKERKDFAQLYHNAFTYNRRLASVLDQKRRTDEESRALEYFSRQQGNFLAAIRYCDRFEADKDELLSYFNNCSNLFTAICSLDGFIRELFAKINLFEGKEKRCAGAILLHAKYFNGEFQQSYAALQRLLPLEGISQLDRRIVNEGILANIASNIYEMEGEALWAAEYAAQHHFYSTFYRSELLNIGEYNPQLAAVCIDDFFTFEIMANLDQHPLERIDAYLAGLHEKRHLQRMQTSYIRAKLEPLPKETIEPLVIVNPYTRGLKNLMLAFIEEDAVKADALYQEAADHLWHIRYYHVESLYFYAKFLQQQGAAKFNDVHQSGLKLSQKHHYRFLQYRFEELVQPSGLAYDSRNYPLPDNQDFSEYINFLIKLNRQRNEHQKKHRVH